MSNPHRTFGDTHDSDDLHREPTTDVPNDADALDALLNKIASGNGTTGSRHTTPNARTDDAASVLETAAAFHRQVETAQGRDARAAGPDPQLWETIMERAGTPSATPEAAMSANPRAARPTQPKRPIAVGRPRPMARRNQNLWNIAANLGLVAAILLMAFGAWRFAGSPGLPGSGDGNGSLPAGNFAMQPATPGGTPESTEPKPAVVPPVATPMPTSACDLGSDIPIFEGIDSPPWDGTAVVLKTTGEVVLTCAEEPEGEVLATTSGRASVAPLGWEQPWPGVVLVNDNADDPDTSRTRIVSLITGDIVEFGVVRSESAALGIQQAAGSPWVVGPAPGDTADVQILDLRTMQTRLLSEIAGTALPEHGGYLLSSSDDGTALAFALMRHQYPAGGEGATLVTDELPGDLLVLNGNLEAASWVSAPADLSTVIGIEVSPDGRYLALHGASGPMTEREHVFSIVRLADGAEIARSSSFTTGPEGSAGVWTEGGLAYIDGSALMVLPIDGQGTAETVFDGNGSLTNLRTTSDASIVLVDQAWAEELPTMVVNMQTPTFYSVNVTTGDAATITGVDVSTNTNPWPYPTRFLVTFDYQLDPPEAITYRVIDALTGETVGTLDDVPLDDTGITGHPRLGLRWVASSADGNTKVIAFDTQHIYLMTIVDGEPVVRQLASPPGIPSEYPLTAQMFLSPDGSLLSLTAEGDEARTRWLLPLDGEPNAWTTVDNETVGSDPGYIFFVPGTSD